MSPIFFAGIISDTAEAFGVDWPRFIAQCVSFGLVALLLHQFAYKPILKVLDERRRRIAEGLDNAQKIKEELARTEAARQKVMEDAATQANTLLEEARAAAARVEEREIRKAADEAEQIIARAREAAVQDHDRMLAELKREVGRLVVATTAKVAGKVLTPQDQERLIQETTRGLAV
ncbi:MAG: F0F1 ATP synthase subunit B [Verrucomicrobia bacterium]|nr:F0F1 ATP synthase subunit B [Verrucomicrobiota bacterium]